MCDSRYRVWEDGHSRDYGNITPGAGSERFVSPETLEV